MIFFPNRQLIDQTQTHALEITEASGASKLLPMLELVASQKQRQFGQAKYDGLPQYRCQCEVRFACNGGCPKNRLITTLDGESGLNYLCAGYKAFFNHIAQPIQMIADLLHQGRYADEVMGLFVI